MILSDRAIQREIQMDRLVVAPLGEKAMQPCSVDVRLDNRFREFSTEVGRGRPAAGGVEPLIPIESAEPRMREEVVTDVYTLRPGGFVLASTRERVEIPLHLVGKVEGKSSLGRYGILVHCTAGLLDPGFKGHITLEVFNASPLPIQLITGMRVAQLTFETLTSTPIRPYGSKAAGSRYQDQARGPVPSRGVRL